METWFQVCLQVEDNCSPSSHHLFMIGCRWNKIFRCLSLEYHILTISELMQPCKKSLKTQNLRKSLIILILSTTLQPSSIHGRLLLRNFQFLALGSNIRNLSFCTCAWLCLYHFVFISQFKSLLIPRVNCPLLFWLQLLYICSKVRSSVLRVAVQRIVRAALFYTRSLKNKAEVE